MVYVALDTADQLFERVKRRAARGGHSASETTRRRIHASSLENLPLALSPGKSGIEFIRIYDKLGICGQAQPRAGESAWQTSGLHQSFHSGFNELTCGRTGTLIGTERSWREDWITDVESRCYVLAPVAQGE